MIGTLEQIVRNALDRLLAIVTTYLPPLLAGLIILAVSFALARLLRWILMRAIKATAIDRFLAQSGLSSLLGRSGRLRAGRLVSGVAYWLVLLTGVLTAVSAFNTNLTSRAVEGVLLLLPRLATAGVILLAGVWLGQYFGRSVLVWACNAAVGHARMLAGAVRGAIVFVAVVAAADYVDFARTVFLTAFVLIVGGAVLAASLAVGLGARGTVERYMASSRESDQEREQAAWNHL